ncbi:DUF2182 domain-containing protein [Leptospira langatensis]|uniref:DUF2182 domain-containing protein n=1 Tax=Leptospira langatensis TaxID=2484983 RepID=A0A5F1ZT20_9LEPT|nr:DUF2182 domain-containing protein [Leptospira langatensis]TGK00310.1 DUF2182 domain-containing protein [Leptospira langatensis]TGL41053.1 DUF2182 domain-containing protein [Leptospira langatensis]
MQSIGKDLKGRWNREKSILFGMVFIVICFSWAAMYDMSWMSWFGGPSCHSKDMNFWPWVATNVTMWILMMVAMMLPSFLQSVSVFVKIKEGEVNRETKNKRSYLAGFSLVSGYLSAWTIYSIFGTGIQFLLIRTEFLSEGLAFRGTMASGILLLIAGVFQFSGWKEKCLTACRSPLGFFLTSWQNGFIGAFRMGWKLGVDCVVCCFLLMALMFVGGLMSILWMIGLTALILAEKLLEGFLPIRKFAGIIFLAWGMFLLFFVRYLH